jgi:hypothetical protein
MATLANGRFGLLVKEVEKLKQKLITVLWNIFYLDWEK